MNDLLAYAPQMAEGLGTTVMLAVAAIPPAFAIGAALAAMQLSGLRVPARAARLYTGIFRGVPELLILFFFYYGIAGIVSAVVGRPVDLSNFQLSAAALACISGAYAGEAFRGAFQAIPAGQWEAGAAIGLHPVQSWFLIILPQAVRIALPSLSNVLLILIKDTALASAIGAEELMRKASIASGSTRSPFLFFGTAAIVYLVVTIPILEFQDRVERKQAAAR
jgi:octopine/nopaline transport system permease protein